MNIRTATVSDQDAISRVFGRSYPTLLQGAYAPELLDIALPLMTVAQPVLLVSGTFYVCEERGKIVGAGGWSRDRWTAHKGHVRHVATDPDHLRKGIARSLLAHVFDAAKRCGLTEMECWSTHVAEPFYTSAGFVTQGPISALLGGTQGFPSICMTRSL